MQMKNRKSADDRKVTLCKCQTDGTLGDRKVTPCRRQTFYTIQRQVTLASDKRLRHLLYCTVSETDYAITQDNHPDVMQPIPRHERSDYVMNLEIRTNRVDFYR
jgi:hypothetical protein